MTTLKRGMIIDINLDPTIGSNEKKRCQAKVKAKVIKLEQTDKGDFEFVK